jgi:hypothetical protein
LRNTPIQEAMKPLFGEWKFYGHDTTGGSNYGGDILGCESCLSDKSKRHKNKIGKPLRSYQLLDGSTNNDEMSWWEFGSCNNINC